MKSLTCLVLALLLASAARAADAPDLQSRTPHYHASYQVAADGTAVETHEWSQTILKDSALEGAKRATVSHSSSAQKADILTAYTRKADGRRIDVPKENFQVEVNSGRGGNTPAFSDWTTVSVLFPDVAVGDTVVIGYRITDIEPMFPGRFSASNLFYRDSAYDDLRVRIEYPVTMEPLMEARGMSEQRGGAGEGRAFVEWRWSNPVATKSKRRDWSVFDPEKEVGYAFSSFRSHAEIAAAYGARALPKAAVTERLARLAGEIVKGRTVPREQARALYEWVATTITYGGNCIGVGAVVPRDLPFVLDNKMGDCKDHATLLQALLAARGIRSTQALINAGALYRLPRIPLAFSVNHVINYLPDFNLFVDSTSESTPFGMLPFSVQDKPVLLVEGHRDGLRTPAQPRARNQQTMRSRMKVAADGSVSGSVEILQSGSDAVGARAWARKMSREAQDELVKNMFRRMGVIGNGSLEKDDPTALTDSYRYKANFQAEKFMKPSGAGAFYVFPPLSLANNILGAVQSVSDPEIDTDTACHGGHMVEEYSIELPARTKVLAIPGDIKVANQTLSYQASYKLKGRVLTARRVLDDPTPGNVCAPAFVAEQRKVAEKVIENLKEQVLYK
ncbi:MAG: DUF3857 and transglutaminase domain-containing protein [Rhodocyclales bacterium]|nr:DUF3857 and transglutaminase domain-containing protein [Rhodocyclales bacterium]